MAEPGPDSRAGALALAGPLTVETAQATWRLLADHLAERSASGAECAVHAYDVSRLDGAGAQLLYAFVREVARRGATVRWISASLELGEAARMLGMTEHIGLTEEALAWRP